MTFLKNCRFALSQKNSWVNGSCLTWEIFDQRRMRMSLILAVMLLAVWLRLWRMPAIPPGLEYDEVINGLDASWMLKTRTPYLFVNSLHGREALFLYPVGLFITLLGSTPFALRFTSAVVGVLAVAFVYRLTIALFCRQPQYYWLALVAAAGLAVSFWHMSMSRTAFRVVLTPTFFALTAYLFWQGWHCLSRRQKLGWAYFCGAGVALGLSQYTYLSARLFPIMFLLLGLGVWVAQPSKQRSKLGGLWLGLLMMEVIGVLVFIPLGLQFLQDPEAFSRRAEQVNFQFQWTADGIALLVRHVLQALSLFFGGSDPRIRHHLVERPVFDWFTLVAFWGGVIIAIRQWRKPEYLFLVLSVFLLWLPGPLSVDPIHSPRTSGLLPAFFILVAVGLFHLINWVVNRFSVRLRPAQLGLVSVGLVILLVGGINVYDYFVRWANHPLVYREYKGPSIDLAQYATTLSRTADVILPYRFYSYAPVRYILRNNFREELTLPFSPFKRLGGERPIIYLTWLEDIPSSSLVWLTYDEAGRGVAYLTRSLPEIDHHLGQPILGRQGNIIATQQTISNEILARMYRAEPIVTTPFIWGEHIRLGGYDLTSPIITAGKPVTITFYWQGLREADLGYNTFIQILNGRGEPISQLEETVIDNDIHYYDNRDGFVLRQYLVWTGADTPPGLYVLRVGLFNPPDGRRLPITTLAGEPVGDQIILTPFYISADGIDPCLPDVSLHASLGQTIELLGYTLSQPLDRNIASSINVKVYWQANGVVDSDYTAFIQLLDADNRVVSQWDTQPLGGLYPTSRWRPGQVVMTEFPLSLKESLAAGTYRLVTGMYDLTTGIRLPAFNPAGQRWPDDMVTLVQTAIP